MRLLRHWNSALPEQPTHGSVDLELNPSDFSTNLLEPLILLMVFGKLVLGFLSLGLRRKALPRTRLRLESRPF